MIPLFCPQGYFAAIASGNIQLKTDLEPVHMNLELAIPCGLILNELVTNAIKHAFPAGQAGEIRVTLRQYDTDGYSLQVADNGVGLPDALAAATVTSLGLRLIRVLTRQIDGQFELVATYPGTEARLTLGAQRDAEQA
jgi:two-component sensor histidine kinase